MPALAVMALRTGTDDDISCLHVRLRQHSRTQHGSRPKPPQPCPPRQARCVLSLLGLIVARALRKFYYMNARLNTDATDVSDSGSQAIERIPYVWT